MKTKIILSVIISVLLGINLVNGQGFQAPAEGKAVIYFVQTLNGIIVWEFFHQDRYIGEFKGKNYLRYECDPGLNLFWVSSENKEFITADLQEGGSYIVNVYPIPGYFKAHVAVDIITVNDTKNFGPAKELINSEGPVTTPDSKIEEHNKKLEEFIKERLDSYENEWKSTKNFKHISPDMAIPAESMK